MQTLKGVFYNPKPAKKNFIQENVRQLREMTNYLPGRGEPTVQFSSKGNKFVNVAAKVPLHVTSGKPAIKKIHPDVNSGLKSNVQPKLQPNPLVASKSSPNKTTKSPKQIRKVRNGVRMNNETEEVRLREGDVAEYVRWQREKVLSNQKEEACDTDLTFEASDSDSVEYIKPPLVFTCRNTAVGHRSTGCQTVDIDSLDSLYDEGIIRYPSAKTSASSKTMSDSKSVAVRNMSQQTDRLQTTLKKSPFTEKRGVQSAIVTTNIDHLDLKSREANSEWYEAQQRGGVGFVHFNAKAVSAAPVRTVARTSDPLKPPSTYQRGIIPRYLQKRQSQWQKEEEKKVHSAPDPNCPPGHVPVPETERKETLKRLRKSYADLIHELNMLPVRADTLRVRQRKMELEKQLNKHEDGIKVFSRPKVFVKIDA